MKTNLNLSKNDLILLTLMVIIIGSYIFFVRRVQTPTVPNLVSMPETPVITPHCEEINASPRVAAKHGGRYQVWDLEFYHPNGLVETMPITCYGIPKIVTDGNGHQEIVANLTADLDAIQDVLKQPEGGYLKLVLPHLETYPPRMLELCLDTELWSFWVKEVAFWPTEHPTRLYIKQRLRIAE